MYKVSRIYYGVKARWHEYMRKNKNEHYEQKMRRHLKNDNFSILCSNCMGGIIYNRLGKQFLSPTINLWMYQYDFVKFIKNLHYYLSLNLQFIDGEYSFPVGKLDDILVFFNHSNSKEEAESDWNRRKIRVNYDNLYVLMYDRDGLTKEDLLSLSSVKCKNLIVLSNKHYDDIDYVYQIAPNLTHDMGEQYMDMDEYGIRMFEKKWDFVEWLNVEKA